MNLEGNHINDTNAQDDLDQVGLWLADYHTSARGDTDLAAGSTRPELPAHLTALRNLLDRLEKDRQVRGEG
jgi:hypothetical protein